MKKRGFTLIELLAVIVILAIIALIATPIVMNVIENSRKGAAERSTENYLSAVETAIATKRLEDSTIANGEYIVNSEGNLCQIGGDCLTVEVSGDRPRNGSTVVISEGIITKESTNIIVNNYDVKYNTESEKIEASNYEPYGYGTKYVLNPGDGDRIFYVLEDGDNTELMDGDTGTTGAGEVSLIMDRNLTSETFAWCLSGQDVSCAADGVKAKISEGTTAWTDERIIDIVVPTAFQIAQASGDTAFKGTKYTGFVNASWLSGYLSKVYNGEYARGYFTSTIVKDSTTKSFFVNSDGRLHLATNMASKDWSGARPVIIISKDDLKDFN